jgi:hypothetical protein
MTSTRWWGKRLTRAVTAEYAAEMERGGTSTITGTGFALVKKPHWTKRLPHYRLKAANYFRRAFWLLRKGMLFPRVVVRSEVKR